MKTAICGVNLRNPDQHMADSFLAYAQGIGIHASAADILFLAFVFLLMYP